MYIKKRILFFVVLVVVATVFATIISNAQNQTSSVSPGSAEDPLITKSYVDEQVASLVAAELDRLQSSFNSKMNEQLSKMEAQFKATNTAEFNKFRQSLKMNPNEVVTITVKTGEQLLAGTGTELIVRSGRALLYSQDNNGASNLTLGRDVPRGALVPNNHLLLFPREGRGLQLSPASKTDLIVLVRGSYQLRKIPRQP